MISLDDNDPVVRSECACTARRWRLVDKSLSLSSRRDHRHRQGTRRRWAIVVLLIALLSACATLDSRQPRDSSVQGVESADSAAVRAMLKLAADRALSGLSGKNADAPDGSLSIELPPALASLSHSLKSYGLGKHLDRLQAQMNQGATDAGADMRDALLAAVDALVIEESRALMSGDASATRYFSVHAGNSLLQAYAPLVRIRLRETGFHDQYRLVLDLYSSMPMSRRVSVDLEAHVVQQGLIAILQRMADQERLIREARDSSVGEATPDR